VAHADELSKAPLEASLRYYDGAQAFSVERLMEQLVGAGVDVRNPKTGVFLCAPPAMMLTVHNGLQKKGVPLDRILYEAYGPLAS
jgi:ferredoxin-NADP reductase